MNNLTAIIESLLFVAEEPLSVERLKKVLDTVEAKEIREALIELARQYEARGSGFGLYEIAGGWQLRSRPEFNEWIKRLLQPSPQRLTKASLETLAIVAYHQPIIRTDIEHIRGVDCGGVLRQLLERKLIRVLGRKDIPGRPLIYATTRLFLELFNLKDLRDLPSPKEIEALTAAQENPQEEFENSDEDTIRQLMKESDGALISSHRGPVKPGDDPFPPAGNSGTTALPDQAPNFRPDCRTGGEPGLPTRIGTTPPRIAQDPAKITVRTARIPESGNPFCSTPSPLTGKTRGPAAPLGRNAAAGSGSPEKT